MFYSMPQSITEAWKDFPFMGPNKEYLEKMQKLQSAWDGFLKSNTEYTQVAQIFWNHFFKDFPLHLQKNFADTSEFNAAKKMQEGLRFFDSCWEKTMQSEEYAKKSSLVLNDLGKFRQQMLELFTPFLYEANIASQQQLSDLSKQIDELRKKVETLEATGEQNV